MRGLRMRGLWMAAGLLALLAGGLWWSNRKEAEKAKNTGPKPAAQMTNIPIDQMQKVEMRRAVGESTVLELKSGKWEITAPRPLPADVETASSLVSSAATLSADRVVEEKASDLSLYGLAKPGLEVVITRKDGKTVHLLLGDETPSGNDSFASLQGDPRVFTIYSYLKTALDKDSNALRDKRLLTFDSDKLSRIELAVKGQTVEFGKNNQSEWQILKPRPLRADGGNVELLLSALKAVKMDPSVSAEDAKKAAAAFASGAPTAEVKVTDAAGTQQLQVRKDKDKNYYARSSVVEGVYKIPAEDGERIDKGLEDFRNKKVFDFGWNELSRIEVREGAKQTVYQKAGEKWMSAGKEMDGSNMQSAIDKLRSLEAVKFPETGFTTAALELVAVSSGGKQVERVALAKSGNDWLARRENEPSLYQLDGKAVEELQKAIAGVKAAAPPAKK
jgi:ribosomal protein L12E/L44/L45/RPP1/RPP2